MKKRFFPLAIIVVVFLSITAIIAATTPTGNQDGGYKPGDVATDFSLKNTDGKMVSLSDYKEAKGFIVVFTCNHCPFSVKYEDRIIDLHKKYAPQGYPVVAINPNDEKKQPEDSYAGMKERAKEKNFPFAYLHDQTQKVAHNFGAARTPHVYLLSKEGGKLVVKYIGAIDDNPHMPGAVEEKFLEKAISEVQAGKTVKDKETKAIGCTIKWASN